MPDSEPLPSQRPQSPLPNGPERITRRDFHRRAARVTAGLLIAAAAHASDTPEPPGQAVPDQTQPGQTPATPPPPGASDAAPEAVSPKPQGLEEALARVRAVTTLPEDDQKELEAQVKSALELSKSLLENRVPDGTEPAFVFRPVLSTRKARR